MAIKGAMLTAMQLCDSTVTVEILVQLSAPETRRFLNRLLIP